MIARSFISTGRSFVTGCGSKEKLISLNALEILRVGITMVHFSEFIYTSTWDFALLVLILLRRRLFGVVWSNNL
jgi:hypothetical protein